MHAWFAMSLGAAGRVNQRPMLRDILIQDMGTGIDLRPNGNGRASALPASEKRVTADSHGCAAHVRFWPLATLRVHCTCLLLIQSGRASISPTYRVIQSARNTQRVL